MALEGNDRSIDFTSAAGGETVLTYDFPIYNAADLDVYLDSSLLVLDSGYTVQDAGQMDGGTITLTMPLNAGQRVQMFRTTAPIQPLDLLPGGPFPAESVEFTLDRLTAAVQDALARAEKSLAFPDISDTPGLDLPDPVLGGFLKVDDNNAEELVWLPGTLPTTLATSAQEVLTAAAGQTVFTFTNTYQPGIGNIHIYINGVRQHVGAFSETDANSITFSEPLEDGDQVFMARAAFTPVTSADAATTTFTQSGISAIPTTVQQKLFEFPSVLDYGAVGDGITDDTAAFNTAVTNHGLVQVPTGTYLLSGAVTINDSQGLAMAPLSFLVATGSLDISGEFLGTDSTHFTLGSNVAFQGNNNIVRPQWFGASDSSTPAQRTVAYSETLTSIATGGRFIHRVEFTTTDATPNDADIRLTLPTNAVAQVIVRVIAKEGTTNRAFYSKRAFVHETGGLAVLDSQQDVHIDVESNPAWGGVTFLTSLTQLRVNFTGLAATNIDWSVELDVFVN